MGAAGNEPPAENQALAHQACGFFLDVFGYQKVQNVGQIQSFIQFVFDLHKFMKLEEEAISSWTGFELDGLLVVRVPDDISGLDALVFKRILVCLMEIAEEKLEVSQIVMCVSKNAENQLTALKAFYYAGFELVHPRISRSMEALSGYHYLGQEL